MAKNLIRKGDAYYCKVAIPRPLRPLFLSERGKPKDAIWEALGPDKTPATTRCAERVAYWTRVFARLQAGETMDDIRRTDERLEQARQGMKVILADSRRDGFSDTMTHHLFSLMYSPDYASILGESLVPAPATITPTTAPVEPSASETVSQAAAAMYEALKRDKRRQTTIDGHKLRVRAFVDACGDVPLTNIARAVASDWLDQIGKGARTGRGTPMP